MFILLGDIILRKEDIISIISTGDNTCDITYKTSSEDQDTYEADISIERAALTLGIQNTPIVTSSKLEKDLEKFVREKLLTPDPFTSSIKYESIIKD